MRTVSGSATRAHTSAIARKVLLVVTHPGVAAAMETLLRLERYDVKRVAKLGEAVRAARSWRADVALVDGTMLAVSEKLTLGIPSIVLAGDEPTAAARLKALDIGRGWVPKDSPPGDLVAAIERAAAGGVVTGTRPRVANTFALWLIGIMVVVFVSLLIYLVWIAIA